MFEIHVEWQEAPGVRDPLLAQTWARLEFRLDGRPMTRYWSDRASSLRDGVYGSVFPLAEWIANNWWSLLYEGLRHHPAEVSARTERPRATEARQWLRRHNLFTCREGMAYPDLTIFRKEDEVVLGWFPDPPVTTTQGRFMDGGMAAIDRAALEAAFESLVERVLERAGEVGGESFEALAELWEAISASRRDHDEATICQRLAMLGQDPYAEDLCEELEAVVLDRLPFSNELVQDLLSASTPGGLQSDVTSTEQLLEGLPPVSEPSASRIEAALQFDPRERASSIPYRDGYARAAEVRKHLKLPDEPLNDLDEVIARLLGRFEQASPVRGKSGIEAAVQVNGVAAISSVERPLKSDHRFLLARALHHWLFVTKSIAPQRLLTKGHDWLQASSRAFAAELLAPASALSRRMAGGADWERHEELADEFEVSPMVIAHQITNNRLD
jgi:hypothetical protein